MLDWYRLYINHPSGISLENTTHKVWYWKGLVSQAELSIKTCKECQHFKRRKNIYGKLPPKIIAALKKCNSVHIDLIGPYSNSTRQHKTYGMIINKDVRFTCMKMIDPATGWFEIFEVPCFDLNEVARGNSEYIYKLSARLSNLLNHKWLYRNPLPHKVVFGNVSNFKQDFTTLLKE